MEKKKEKRKAEMGYCYGSEYHLMRFLGHHRDELEAEIKKNPELNGEIKWLDFPYDLKRRSGDGEHKGVCFFKKDDQYLYNRIKPLWKSFWATTGEQPNWDAIFKVNGVYVIVEAKAHIGELNSKTGCGHESRIIIEKAFDKTKEFFKVSKDQDWTKQYYQFANRLAFTYFLNEICQIEARLLYVYFINGYQVKTRAGTIPESTASSRSKACKSVTNVEDWEKAIQKEYQYLGLENNELVDKYMNSVYLDCLKKKD